MHTFDGILFVELTRSSFYRVLRYNARICHLDGLLSNAWSHRLTGHFSNIGNSGSWSTLRDQMIAIWKLPVIHVPSFTNNWLQQALERETTPFSQFYLSLDGVAVVLGSKVQRDFLSRLVCFLCKRRLTLVLPHVPAISFLRPAPYFFPLQEVAHLFSYWPHKLRLHQFAAGAAFS